MRVAFTPGASVQFKNGDVAQISNYIQPDCWVRNIHHWRMPGYLGEGFYQIRLESGKEIIAHEDDLSLVQS